jgi:hypothetical protein
MRAVALFEGDAGRKCLSHQAKRLDPQRHIHNAYAIAKASRGDVLETAAMEKRTAALEILDLGCA